VRHSIGTKSGGLSVSGSCKNEREKKVTPRKETCEELIAKPSYEDEEKEGIL
jgi:hypothetical protein